MNPPKPFDERAREAAAKELAHRRSFIFDEYMWNDSQYRTELSCFMKGIQWGRMDMLEDITRFLLNLGPTEYAASKLILERFKSELETTP